MRNRLSKSILIFANLAVIAIVVMFITSGHSNGLSVNSVTTLSPTASATINNPLDQVSSQDIALEVARTDNLPEATAVANQQQSQSAEISESAVSSSVVAKPQVVQTALKSRQNISSYVTQTGDTLASLATKFGVTSNSIMWSNNLQPDSTLSPGTKLIIPPINGIVYTVKPGDTPASLATEFSSNANQIIAYNDAEISGLTNGEQIIIPNGQKAAPTLTASAISGSSSQLLSSVFPWGGSAPIYGYNGYDYGYCTWYVATQIAVPSNWGNAATWAYYAGLSGWNVSTTPTVGAIAQTANAPDADGEGHVAIVDAVSADGSQIEIRDMNGIAGWGRVGYSSWIPATTFEHFITK